ncbi:MAG: tetratricopeptide repeat protein [Hyphomicrobiales bacterium]
MSTIVEDFLESAPDGAASVLQALAAAESLTDDVARQIYKIKPIAGVPADLFVRALHYTDFVAPRNSEWHFVPDVRRELQALGAASPDIINMAHGALIRLGAEGDPASAGSVIPGYLFTDGGRAYHLAATGDQEQALALYSGSARGPLSGAQWLASKLADEQEARGVLPRGRTETMFLRAMVLVREGHRKDAEPLLRRISSHEEVRSEVAISCHVLAGMISRTNRVDAERLFRKSIAQKEVLNDLPGLAHSLHSLANLLSRDPRQQEEAEGLYRRSIEILERLGDRHGIAQTLHSLANLLSRDPRQQEEVEGLYRRSIEIGEDLGDQYGVAQRLHSLANFLGRNPRRHEEAEVLYRRSIKIGEDLGNQHHVAQTLHSLANLLRRDPRRHEEAERLYRRSIEILEKLGDQRGVAQTLRSLSFAVEQHSPKEAEQLLMRSLELNRQRGDRRGEQLVRRSLQRLRDRYRL